VETKQCPMCGERKPLTTFPGSRGGRVIGYCRPCWNAYMRGWRRRSRTGGRVAGPPCPHGERWYRCRPCWNAYERRRRRRLGGGDKPQVAAPALAALAAAPNGLRVDELRARLGYRQSREAMRQLISVLVRVKGVPIERRWDSDRRVRYVLVAS
jgi:hypothetical protein